MTTTHYTAAPATKMLATHCAVCARPLLDAQSVECGVGPECRKRYGFDRPEATDALRKMANALVHDIALARNNPTLKTYHLVAELHRIGWVTLAAKIGARLCKVRIDEKGDTLSVTTPYSPHLVGAMRAIGGAYWSAKDKAWQVPAAAKVALHKALVDRFVGVWAYGPRGPFQIGAPTSVAA